CCGPGREWASPGRYLVTPGWWVSNIPAICIAGCFAVLLARSHACGDFASSRVVERDSKRGVRHGTEKVPAGALAIRLLKPSGQRLLRCASKLAGIPAHHETGGATAFNVAPVSAFDTY